MDRFAIRRAIATQTTTGALHRLQSRWRVFVYTLLRELKNKRWWYHPQQGRRCAVTSFFLGRKLSGGAAWHPDGTNHWWSCGRCCV